MNTITRTSGLALSCLVLLSLTAAAGAADLDGAWDFVFSNENGDYPRTISLEVDGEKVTGRIGEELLEGTFRDGKLELSGEHYALEGGYTSTLKISGELEDDRLEGKATWDYYDLTFVATRHE